MMLPGLRFFLAAILLSLSMLAFGLGAAALLRSAHQDIASLPTRWLSPAADLPPPADEASQPTLALLRIDAPAADSSGPAAAGIEPAIDPPPDLASPLRWISGRQRLLARLTAAPPAAQQPTATLVPSGG